MVGANLIKRLKQSNVSVDADKTKQRVGELFKAASASEKKEIENVSGLGRATIYKAYGTGGLSAKLAIAIAQTLNVSPFYLTGDADEQETCSDDTIKSFLIGKDKSYAKLLDEVSGNRPKKARSGRKSAKPATDEDSDTAQSDSTSVPANQPAVEDAAPPIPNKDFIESMSEEQMILLMRAIILKAEFGIPECVDKAYRLKLFLTSNS